ncbi:MAG: metal-dependent transcriptional regulator [Phycisphaerae bacterium]|nr:metal-dependent transcriptional regulator [Phycisphaerae bacterium]
MAIRTDEKLSASLEDYLEAIYHLTVRQDVARSKDIANSMGVTRASVTGALRALSEKGLVHYKPYGYTTLTEKGRQAAGRVARRHEILAQFFGALLGVDAATAETAACKAEHALGPEITARLMAFVEFLSQTQDDGKDVAQQFQAYWETLNESKYPSG